MRSCDGEAACIRGSQRDLIEAGLSEAAGWLARYGDCMLAGCPEIAERTCCTAPLMGGTRAGQPTAGQQYGTDAANLVPIPPCCGRAAAALTSETTPSCRAGMASGIDKPVVSRFGLLMRYRARRMGGAVVAAAG